MQVAQVQFNDHNETVQRVITVLLPKFMSGTHLNRIGTFKKRMWGPAQTHTLYPLPFQQNQMLHAQE